jgi:hypothetical protein
VPDFIPCGSPETCVNRTLTEWPTEGNDYCNSCFMLPDPRVNEVEQEEYTALVWDNFGTSRHIQSQAILDRVTGLDTSDLLAFVGPQYQPVTKGVMFLILYYYELLLSDFWWHFLHPRLGQPTEFHRMIILQMRTFHYHKMQDIAARNMKLKQESIKVWKKKNGKVDISSLKHDELNCTICRQQFGVVDEDGEIEIPVKTNNPDCPHIFGETCLFTWMTTNDTCPMCRRKLESIDLDINSDENVAAKKAEDQRLEVEAIARGTPAWLIALHGYDPEERGPQVLLNDSPEAVAMVELAAGMGLVFEPRSQEHVPENEPYPESGNDNDEE